MFTIKHFGAVRGVDGSLHELEWRDFHKNSHRFWVDCGGWVGDAPEECSKLPDPLPDAIFITHAHYDHIGRLPEALVAGYQGPIYATPATCLLLEVLIEENLRLKWTRDRRLIAKVIKLLQSLCRPIPQKQWFQPIPSDAAFKVRFHPAGHILGSAWIEFRVPVQSQSPSSSVKTIIFSGDIGRSASALLPAPEIPKQADVVVLESTYGGRFHPSPSQRKKTLQNALAHALENGGSILVPAFSLGRVQEMLVELDQLKRSDKRLADLEILLDSPIALKLTELHRDLRQSWSEEARIRWKAGIRPLDSEAFTPIESHRDHLQTVKYLAQSGRPALVLASSGMCEGGRIVNYLEKMLPDPRHDLLFLGFQAKGTLGAAIQRVTSSQRKGSRKVAINGKDIIIRAQVNTISGYSAHADHDGLMRFVGQLNTAPKEIRLVHGDPAAKKALQVSLRNHLAGQGTRVICPG